MMPSWSSDSSSSRSDTSMPLGDDAAHGLGLQRDAGAGDVAAGGREHADHAGLGVGRAAHHLDHARAGVDLAHLQLVGVGMALGLDHAGDGEGFELGRGIVDAFHLEPDQRQLLRQLGDAAPRCRDDPSARTSVNFTFEPLRFVRDLRADAEPLAPPIANRFPSPLRGGVRGGGKTQNHRFQSFADHFRAAVTGCHTSSISPDIHPTPNPSPSRGGEIRAARVGSRATAPPASVGTSRAVKP